MSPLEAALVVTAVMLAFFAVLAFVSTETRVTAHQVFPCPLKQIPVSIEFASQGLSPKRQRVDVLSCSAFEDSHKITCSKDCLQMPGIAA